MSICENASLSVSRPPDASGSFPEATCSSASVPLNPLIKIRATKRWAPINLRDVWEHRELLYFLIWRDLKVRYKQTLLGVSWIVLQPLLMTLVFAVFLGKIARVPSGSVPYVLFLYSGLLPWTFFTNAVATSSHSLIVNAQMITKVFFPRSMVPLAAVLVRLSDFIVASVVLIVLMIYYGRPFTRATLLAPFLILHLTLLALSLALVFAALNVKYRDIGTVLPVLLQIWLFASPVIYPANLVPPNWQWVYGLNPLTGIIDGFRAALLNLPFNWRSLLVSLGITLALLVYSSFFFRRMEDGFADVV
ncbi:MAG TPA: ABC transporter permease [Pyrinomonadaceae bacterium]|nr:ABC transporter permease [Pyrinomonadaceae bacterium]